MVDEEVEEGKDRGRTLGQDKAHVRSKDWETGRKSDQAEACVRSEDSERGLDDIERRLCHRDLNPNEMSYGLLPNLWLSNLLEKHNQVQIEHFSLPDYSDKMNFVNYQHWEKEILTMKVARC